MCTLRDIRNYTPQVLPGRSNLAHAITGFLFAVHPIHSEAVAGIVGRADLLACFLTLTSFLTYSAHCNRARSPLPLLLALVSSALATLAKETGISSLALCLLWELCRGEPSRKVRVTRYQPSLSPSDCDPPAVYVRTYILSLRTDEFARQSASRRKKFVARDGSMIYRIPFKVQSRA